MDSYNDALKEELKKNTADTFKKEAKDKKLSKAECAQVALDIAGIFDPTPGCDLASALISAARGDGVGAILSLVSAIPYVGDAIAKPAKLAKLAPKTLEALEKYVKSCNKVSDKLTDWAGQAKLGNKGIIKKGEADQFNQILQESGLSLEQVAAARKKALETVQKAMRDAKQKNANCLMCKLPDNGKRMLQFPRSGKDGKWKTNGNKQPENGTGVFELTPPKTLPPPFDKNTEVTKIQFKNYAPDFDQYVVGGKHDLLTVTGDVATDERLLIEMMKKKNPNYKPPLDTDYVLHHFEDGKIGYVPKVLHDKDHGGVGHTGGNSMINNELF